MNVFIKRLGRVSKMFDISEREQNKQHTNGAVLSYAESARMRLPMLGRIFLNLFCRVREKTIRRHIAGVFCSADKVFFYYHGRNFANPFLQSPVLFQFPDTNDVR